MYTHPTPRKFAPAGDLPACRVATSEEGGLGPIGIVAGGLELLEPEADVSDGGLATRHVRLPPPVGGAEQVPEVATRFRLLDDQGAQIGEVVFEASRLDRLEDLGG